MVNLMSFSFVRRYVQRHGRADAFSSMLSTKSYTNMAVKTKGVLIGLNELDGILPRPASPENLTKSMAQMKIEDPVVLGQRTSDLIKRSPSPETPLNMHSFAELIRSKWLLSALGSMNIERPTRIQALLLEKLNGSKADLLIKAHTGTGKTFGYIVALLNSFKSQVVETDQYCAPNLIMVPNSIIANQLVRWVKTFAGRKAVPLTSMVRTIVTEGDGVDEATVNAAGYSHILIATPKGLLSRLAQGAVDIEHLSTIVIDEADHLMKPLSRYATLKEKQNRKKHPIPAITAISQIRQVFERNPRARKPRTLVFSASLNSSCREFIKAVGVVERDALFLEDHKETGHCPELIDHYHRLQTQPGSLEELSRLIYWIQEAHPDEQGLVLLEASKSKTELRQWLESVGSKPALLSEQTLDSRLLIGSDVDARGFDLPSLSYVVIVGKPESTTSYLHMAGRVGRMGRTGQVYTILANPEDLEVYFGQMSRLSLTSSLFIPH